MPKEIKKTEKNEQVKPVGPVIHASPTLHGRRVKLKRGEKEVDGILLAQDGQSSNEKLVFQWKNEEGVSKISPVTGDELEILLSGK